jgi:hypothetical protein
VIFSAYAARLLAQQANAGQYSLLALVVACAGLGLRWLAWAGCLFALVLLAGGRANYQLLLRTVAVAWLPLAFGWLVQAVYILLHGQAIASAGLSGFVSVREPVLLQLWLRHLLAQIDIYLLASLLGMSRLVSAAGRLRTSQAAVLVGFTWAAGVCVGFLPDLLRWSFEWMQSGWYKQY